VPSAKIYRRSLTSMSGELYSRQSPVKMTNLQGTAGSFSGSLGIP